LACALNAHGNERPLTPAHPLIGTRIASIREKIVGQAAVTLGDQALVSLVNFSSFFVFARHMEEVALGHFAIGYSVILVFTAFQQSLVGSAFQVKADKHKGKSLRRFTTVVVGMQGALSLSMGLSLAAVGAGLAWAGRVQLGWFVATLGLSVIPWMSQDLIRKIFYTLGRSKSALANDIVGYGLQMAGAVWLVLRPGSIQAWEGLAVYGGASLVASVLGFVQLRDLIRPRLLKDRSRASVMGRDVWSHGKWLAGSQIWRQIGFTGHTWIIAIILGPAALGAYRAAAHLTNVFNPVELAIQLWLPPQASRRFHEGGARLVQTWFKKVVPLLLAPTAAGALVFVFFSGPIVELAYPGKYEGMGLQWLVALVAVSRVINFGRDLFHNALLASNRPDTALVDGLLLVGLKYGVGIPAVLLFGVLGAPAATFAVAIATLSYNRKTFTSVAASEKLPPQPDIWRQIGDGSEGAVFQDVGPGVVTKIYKDDDVVDEAWRYYIALLAAAERVDQQQVQTPRAIEFEPDIPLIQMTACAGRSLRTFVCGPDYHSELGRQVARRLWYGMKAIPEATTEPTYDLWPDNVLYDVASDRLTIIDFVAGNQMLPVAGGSLGAHTLGGFLGHALYEMSRPTRWFRLKDNLRIRSFAKLLWQTALRDGESAEHLKTVTRAIFRTCSGSGSPERRAWYRTIGTVFYRLNTFGIFNTPGGREPAGPPMICHYLIAFPTNEKRTANGVHKAVRGLAGGLAEHDIQTEIVTEAGVRCSWTTPDGVDVHAFRRRGRLLPGSRLAHGIMDHITSMPDHTLFVVHGQFSPRVARMAALLRRLKRPYVVMPHTLYNDAVFAKNRLVKWVYWHLVEKRMLDGAALIQILDDDQSEPLRRRGVSTPTAVVPNAIDPALTLPDDVLTWSSDGPIRLYYLGRINFHQKALDILVRAAAVVKDEFDIQLTIQGPDAGDLEALKDIVIKSGASEVVTILPPDFHHDSQELMARHDVFCMPSRIEGFPMAAMEALQAGRPLLFTNVSGLTTTIRESGCGELVSPNLDDVVRGLRAICSRRSEFAEMGRSGRDYIEVRFSPAASAGIALDAYERIVPSRTANSSSHRPAGSVGPAPERDPAGRSATRGRSASEAFDAETQGSDVG
jgi:glycosyltransferase involved in cell wall biosynthesis/O-antigen/teichoic acid export membrane protein